VPILLEEEVKVWLDGLFSQRQVWPKKYLYGEIKIFFVLNE
jgi:hypothetical protein